MNDEKSLQRKAVYQARNAQANQDQLSQLICQQFMRQPFWASATTVMLYMHCRSEVRTTLVVSEALAKNKQVVIPYCTFDEWGQRQLGLWRLRDPDELQSGLWGILEPPKSRWLEPDRQVQVQALDVVMMPGVAFDKQGGRLGNGAGYYDRLLVNVRQDTVLAAVCYEVQLLPKIVMEPHDIFMDFVITEQAVYPGIRQLHP